MNGFDDEEAPQIQEHTLGQCSELRVDCDERDFFVELVEGTAEVFGCELQPGGRVNIKGQKLAVFTWRGCRLKTEGYADVECYVESDTPMPKYLELHAKLNTLRDRAQAQQQCSPDAGSPAGPAGPGQGPRVVIVGPMDSGKSTLSRMLLNWAVRCSYEPTYVDLDVGQGSITCPGCISAVPVEAPLQPTGSGATNIDMPLVLFYGHASAQDNPELYKFLVDRMASLLDKRASSPSHKHAAASGLVVNTLGWITDIGYELQLHAIIAFKADVVVVLDKDALHAKLSHSLAGRGVDVIKLPKSGGVVERKKEDRKAARDARVREYFTGADGSLTYVPVTSRTDQLKVLRIGGGPKAPSSALPIGVSATAYDPLKVSGVTVTPELTHALLAVSHGEKPEEVLTANVAGFILVKEVDPTTGMVTYLSPSQGALPGRYLLYGSIRAAMD